MVKYLVDHSSARMGGVGFDVQVDETVYGHNKYNRGNFQNIIIF